MKMTAVLSVGGALFGFLSLVNLTAVAAENEIRAKISTGENVQGEFDREVVDPKLRVLSGAQKKWSSSLNLNYAGAALRKPFGDQRPNPEGYAVPEPVSAAGNLGVRYRWQKNESLYFATGFFQERPLHKQEDRNRLQVNTPQISYNQTQAEQNVQLSQSVQLYISTQDYLREVGDLGSLAYGVSAVNPVGESRWSGGVSLLARISAFDKNSPNLKAIQSDYGFSLTPLVQYSIRDHIQVFSSVSLVNWNHMRSESGLLRMRSLPISQSLGVGIAFFRDFYFAPNLNFDPAKLSDKNTSVNFNLTLNL